MVLEKLGNALKGAFEKITRSLFIDEALINDIVKDIQKALLQADVNVQQVFALSKQIKERAIKEKVPKGMSQREWLIKIIYEELVQILGGPGDKITIAKKPFIIMLVGLFGNGKTTTAGKLAKFYKSKGYQVAVVQTDTWRPAAYEQLSQLATQAGVAFFGDKTSTSPQQIFLQHKKALEQFDILIVDTAGRDALSDELIAELAGLAQTVHPDEVLLVMGAELGQAAQKQAQAFHDTAGVTGVIITRMDGTAKGGGAITACATTGAPVKFIGVGEKINDLEAFYPERFVSRMLGMGDIQTLLEKASEVMDQEQAKDVSKKFLKGEFNLLDLYEQMSAMKKMGPLTKLVDMLPGFGSMKIPKEMLAGQEEKLKKWKYIMDSCTKQELEDPEIISVSRTERIAKGSGTTVADVRELLKQYKQSKKVFKMMKGSADPKQMEKMMKRMGGGFGKHLPGF
ncbi:MAG: signal recognition particle protein Srp54 [Candidatus Woesearchaeota archaeon]